jgi:serine protease Do
MNASVKLIESVLPSSVGLRARIPETHPSAAILGTERLGSGTYVDAAGLVLTVNYVVLGATELEVMLVDHTTVSGEVVAQDFFTGLAVVRVPGRNHPAVSVTPSSTLALGHDVFILAAAGDAQRRVNSGLVSSLAAFDAYWEYSLERGIRTTAMNPGLGGGGLFSARGHLVGVVALDLGEVGRFTLAIPAELFWDHREELLRYGRRTTRSPRAWLGLFCYELREHVVIAGVLPGAPGERAGLKPGDVVLAIDGTRIHARRALYETIWAHRPGDALTVQVFRQNAVQRLAVVSADVEQFFA